MILGSFGSLVAGAYRGWSFWHYSFWDIELSLGFLKRSLLHYPSFWRCPDFSFFWEGYVTNSFNLKMFSILLCLRNYTDDIVSWVENLLMIAEIKYLLGFVGRFVASAFNLAVIWTFSGRTRHKLLHLGDDPNLLWPRGSNSSTNLQLDDDWEIPFADIWLQLKWLRRYGLSEFFFLSLRIFSLPYC